MKIILIKKFVYNVVNKFFNALGYKVINKDLHYLIDLEQFNKKQKKKSPENFISFIFKNKNLSYSQIFQDLFVDFVLNKKNGIFCEVGAADGKNLSNTYYLEKYKNWKGLLCEPSKHWKAKLKKNRKKAVLIFDAIDGKIGEKVFYENKMHLLSGFNKISKNKYVVKTATLNKILDDNKVKKIDYLSIDTEGNEFQIISKFNFKKYRPKVITIEHNYSHNKQRIKKLMNKYGYKLVFPFFSRFDSFYVSTGLSKKFGNKF